MNIQYLGTREYSQVLELQREIFDKIINNKLDKNYSNIDKLESLLLVEHPHVYTLGKNGDVNNLLINKDFLDSINASYFNVDRGGDITYHGYGQLVGYPILDLERHKLGIKNYIWAIEESVIRTIAEYGITGERLSGATGVWIEPNKRARKICAIGIRASRWVTMHGFALNVSTDLKYFSYINPCGFIDKGVSSIEKECNKKVNLTEVAEKFTKHFIALIA